MIVFMDLSEVFLCRKCDCDLIYNSFFFAVNMDVPNGYLNNHRYGGNANQGGGNDFNQRQTVHHRQMGPGGSGVPGSAQTVNHGTNFFNFYFVNSGAYDLNFAGSGLGGQASEPHQVPQYSNPTHNRAPTGMFST